MFSGVVEAVLLEKQHWRQMTMSKCLAVFPHLSLSNTMQIEQNPSVPEALHTSCVCSCCLHALCWIMVLMTSTLASIRVWLWQEHDWIKLKDIIRVILFAVISLGTVADIAFCFYFAEEGWKLWMCPACGLHTSFSLSACLLGHCGVTACSPVRRQKQLQYLVWYKTTAVSHVILWCDTS